MITMTLKINETARFGGLVRAFMSVCPACPGCFLRSSSISITPGTRAAHGRSWSTLHVPWTLDPTGLSWRLLRRTPERRPAAWKSTRHSLCSFVLASLCFLAVHLYVLSMRRTCVQLIFYSQALLMEHGMNWVARSRMVTKAYHGSWHPEARKVLAAWHCARACYAAHASHPTNVQVMMSMRRAQFIVVL